MWDVALAEELRAELAEADRFAVWRTRQALAEFEDAWRELLKGRKRIPDAAERRHIKPLPTNHPLTAREPWSDESLDRATWRATYDQRNVPVNQRYPEVGDGR
jgi:hypothetical protein